MPVIRPSCANEMPPGGSSIAAASKTPRVSILIGSSLSGFRRLQPLRLDFHTHPLVEDHDRAAVTHLEGIRFDASARQSYVDRGIRVQLAAATIYLCRLPDGGDTGASGQLRSDARRGER